MDSLDFLSITQTVVKQSNIQSARRGMLRWWHRPSPHDNAKVLTSKIKLNTCTQSITPKIERQTQCVTCQTMNFVKLTFGQN